MHQMAELQREKGREGSNRWKTQILIEQSSQNGPYKLVIST